MRGSLGGPAANKAVTHEKHQPFCATEHHAAELDARCMI